MLKADYEEKKFWRSIQMELLWKSTQNVKETLWSPVKSGLNGDHISDGMILIRIDASLSKTHWKNEL